VRRYVAPWQVRWSLSVFFSVLSVPLWFILRQLRRVCAPEHGEKTVNGYQKGNRTQPIASGVGSTPGEANGGGGSLPCTNRYESR